MENKNEILVGALTVIGITLFILGFKYLQGEDLFTRSKYITIVADRTNNVLPSNSVLENGVPIGRVDDVSISTSPTYPYKALITLKMNEDVSIPNDSKFIIYGLDMLGKVGVGLVRGTSTVETKESDTLICLVKGDAITQGVDLIAQLKPKIDSTLGSITALANNITTALGTGDNNLLKKAVSDLTVTLQSVNKLAGNADKMIVTLNSTLTDNRSNIDGILKNVNELTGKFNGEMGKIDSILTNFQTLSGKVASLDLASTLESAKGTLDQLKKTLSLINDGDGTVSKLLKEDGAYKDITRAIQSLNAVLVDLKANPKKYISLSLIDRSRTITITDTSVQQFLEKNPKAAKTLK